MKEETTPANSRGASPRPSLTAERLREVLDYDPDTGEFRWKPRPGNAMFNRRHAGHVAGCPGSGGYINIMVDGRNYPAHRLAHLYIKGKWPRATIDHVDRDRADNRWDKLRAANASQQTSNQGLNSRNTSGCKGVCWDKSRGRWRAYVKVRGKKHPLGRYADFEKAVAARKAGEKKFHGAFAHHARRAPEARAAA